MSLFVAHVLSDQIVCGEIVLVVAGFQFCGGGC